MSEKRKADEHKRTVFKHVLESPAVHYQWLQLEISQEKLLLAELATLFKPIQACNNQYKIEKNVHFTAKQTANKQKIEFTEKFTPSQALVDMRRLKATSLENTIIGVNALNLQTLTDVEIVFICKEDMHAGIIHSHIPLMLQNKNIKLVSLRKGSEKLLADMMSIKRISALSFKKHGSVFEKVRELCKDIPAIEEDHAVLSKTSIKSIETTAPMRNKKQRR